MGQTVPKMLFCMTLVLAFLVVSASLPQAQATTFTETRYFTTDLVYTYKGNEVQGFTTYQSADGWGYNYGYPAPPWNATANTKFQFGIRAWLFEYNSSLVGDELTGGTPKAVVERISAGEGMQNNTWTPALTNLTRTQSILIKVYTRRFTVFWFGWFPIIGQLLLNPAASFFSEGLGMTQLLNTTAWNVYYYTAFRTAGTYKWGEYYWGNSTYNSRIENIQLNDGVTGLTDNDINTHFVVGGTLGGVVVAIFSFAYFITSAKARKNKPDPYQYND